MKTTTPALGYIVGEPFKPVVVRPGLPGILDRLELRARARQKNGTCGWCGANTPGYSWCSRECSEAWDDANPL